MSSLIGGPGLKTGLSLTNSSPLEVALDCCSSLKCFFGKASLAKFGQFIAIDFPGWGWPGCLCIQIYSVLTWLLFVDIRIFNFPFINKYVIRLFQTRAMWWSIKKIQALLSTARAQGWLFSGRRQPSSNFWVRILLKSVYSMLSRKQDIYAIPPLQWFRLHRGEGPERLYERASSGHSKIAALINSQGCGCLHKINSQCSASRWEGFTSAHLLLRSHQQSMDSEGDGTSIFFKGVVPGRWNTLQ